jgi:signal peptidase II
MNWLTRQASDALASLRDPAAHFRYGLVLAVLIAVADRLSKWAILYWVDLPARQKITITPFFDLTMVWNPGISYGLLPANSTWSVAVLVIFALVVTAALTVWLARIENRLLAAGVAMVIGGAVGNAYDRVVYGAVADFVSLHAFGFYWYVFNVADVAIVVGVVLLIWDAVFGPEAREERARRQSPGTDNDQ